MAQILLISDVTDKIDFFRGLFSQYQFDAITDASYVDNMTEQPDVIIFDNAFSDIKSVIKKIKSKSLLSALILLTDVDDIDPELVKYVNAFITADMSDNLILSTVLVNLKTKSALDQLSQTNKNLADSLYRLNVLYSTSSKFAGTLDKNMLINHMIEGLDKSLSFDLTCTLEFCTNSEPVLILNSLYDISDELLSAIKMRTILNYKSLFKDGNLPCEIEEKNLNVIKSIKYSGNKFTFNLFEYDTMFAPISFGDNFFGCIEIFKETPFSSDDATCFQTIVQQVSLPLKSASLYQKIIDANEKLEKLQHIKSEFISIVSHELRTPLTSINNYLNLISRGSKCGELNETGKDFLLRAQKNVERLARIINDLLDLSKIEEGKMEYHFENIDIHSVIDYVKTSLLELAHEKGLNLIAEETPGLPQIYGDSKRLEQVLNNLVGNAIKFTPEGRNIIIRSHIADASDLRPNKCFADDLKHLNGTYVIVSVEDEGIGMAEADLRRAFDKFAQIENSLSRSVGGSGLGLPIAKQMLQAHNGAIWCDSELNKGSKFYFALPLAENKILIRG